MKMEEIIVPEVGSIKIDTDLLISIVQIIIIMFSHNAIQPEEYTLDYKKRA